MENHSKKIIEYFTNLDRSKFMAYNKEFAKYDSAFSIGYGQTISQPSLVLEMTLLLDLKPDFKILEIGTGSGYQTALLSPFVKSVYTVERIKELHDEAVKRLNILNYINIYFKLGDGSFGWEEFAPYDRIIVTAACSVIPKELLDQLKNGGKMVIPLGTAIMQKLTVVEKDKNGEIKLNQIENVQFVRLIGKYD
ncbi:protein-L-isoaspartate(D-aspartate) O-methyltransferase [Clostridiaceae bacterium HSG29]|nr:protein-L-isoaspartate(D-aspartate) O-methyltransferase [Clostridiaceae bacterium HSG29]